MALRSKCQGGDKPRRSTRSMCVSFPIRDLREASRVLDVHSIRDNLKTLTIWLARSPWEQPGDGLPSGELPALQTLILPIGTLGHPLLNVRAMKHCGKLRAPSLRRLVISHASNNLDWCQHPISPAALTLFITHHLDLAPGRVLDELVLEEGCIRLGGNEIEYSYDYDLGVLDSYVATRLVMSTALIRTLA
ncbi:hypothetical protein AURDEDRAFT_170617 [Auricularia subglabra TFB-10046 SS5]|nr:hypothetical protein AURDEDRAFT_170617 [Auricularia subglabra TFB-10046 SS5]